MTKRITKKAIHAPYFLNEPIEYQKSFTRGLNVGLGEYSILFVSGTASLDEKGKSVHAGDFWAQTKRTYDNLTALLKNEGATWHDVVQTRCYVKSMKKYYAQFNKYRNQFYKKMKLNPFPASVGIEATLCRPELLVEIELIAIIKSKRKRKKR